uniref:Uncharacterized protein n=2 Tax=Caenorhabditis japonica TaxID=281687 RepID=A0A8R1IAK6_CAEJA
MSGFEMSGFEMSGFEMSRFRDVRFRDVAEPNHIVSRSRCFETSPKVIKERIMKNPERIHKSRVMEKQSLRNLEDRTAQMPQARHKEILFTTGLQIAEFPDSCCNRQRNFPEEVMVWTGITSTGKTPFVFVPLGVEIYAANYLEDIGPTNKTPRLHTQPKLFTSGASTIFLSWSPIRNGHPTALDYSVWCFGEQDMKEALQTSWDDLDPHYLRAIPDETESLRQGEGWIFRNLSVSCCLNKLSLTFYVFIIVLKKLSPGERREFKK